MEHVFTKDNRLILWAHNRMKCADGAWFKYSIQILQRKMIQDFINVGVHMIIPVPKTHEELLTDYYPKSDLIDYVPVEVSYLNECLHIHDFKQLVKRQDYRCVLNLEGMSHYQLLAALSKPRFYFRPVMVNYVLFSPVEGLVDTATRVQIGNIFLSNPTIFNGPASMNDTISICRNVFLPSFVRSSSEKNWKSNTLGINCEKIDQCRSDRLPSDKIRFLYGGRLTSHKHVEDSIDVVKFLYESGVQAKYLIQTYGMLSSEKAREFEKQHVFVQALIDQPQDEFYKNAFQSDVFVCLSRIESYGLSFFEMLYCGMVGVFLKQDWQRGIIPEWYPFVFNNMKDLKVGVKWIAQNLDEAKKMIENIPKFILEKENASLKNIELLEMISSFSPVAKDDKKDNLEVKE